MDDRHIYVGCGFRTSDVTKKEMESFIRKHGTTNLEADTASYISDVINKQEGLKIFRPLGGAFVLFEGIHFLGEDEKRAQVIRTREDLAALIGKYFPGSNIFPHKFWMCLEDDDLNFLAEEWI